MQTPIETARFILREIQIEDVQDIYELDSAPEVHKYLGNKPIGSLSEAEKIIEHIRDQYMKYGIGRWAVIDKETHAFLGWSGLKFETMQTGSHINYYDLGYRLKPAHWGKGIASETALAWMKHGFEEMNLKEISGAAHVDNIASNIVLARVGLKRLETFAYDGAAHHWYSLPNLEWKKKINQK